MSDGFWLTCLINYKNKNNLLAFHDTKLASQTIKIFYKNIYKINYFKTTTTKKQKADKNIHNLIEQFFIVFFLNLACRLINE